MERENLDGTGLVFSGVDDLAAEVELLSQNQEFMDFLAKRSQSSKRLSLAEARQRLGIS
ncbi:MAG: hypothetical protein KME17_08940 [Cyanosarcina radialis HA8281-LM2]|jgi:hypothetical protein|nr:hypothetical protein [Cyanosarcina radialis HA8281-LM2]